MSFIVDQYGTRQWSFSLYDSDNEVGYRQGDSVIKNGIVYVATTDIPAGVPFALADSELDAQKWIAKVTGAEAAAVSLLSDVDVTGLKNGDTLVWDSDLNLWKPGTAGSNIVFRDESFIVDSDGQDTFFLDNTPTKVTAFYRNGMKLIWRAFDTTDSDAVIYDSSNNGGYQLASGDEIQITYTTTN